MIGRTISHYHILERLAEGGMGVVYVAEDTRLGRRVAVKLPTGSADDQHFRARFLREARSISSLSHPHIATLHDYGETEDGQPFIVMELVNGGDLSELLRKEEMTLGRAVEIIEDVAEALAEAHARGIIHRDIKPSNVMINQRGEVKVLDFGLAKQIEEGASRQTDREAKTLIVTHTRSDAVIGTPLYLSPEQATATSVDARSDLFALGTLLYECVAGRPPFSGINAIDIVAQVLYLNPPPPSHFNPHVAPELDRITMKALSKKPEERYQTAEELIADLRAVRALMNEDARAVPVRSADGAGIAAATVAVNGAADTNSAFGAVTKNLRRPRFSTFFVLVLAALLCFGAWGVVRLWKPRPHQPTPEAARWYRDGENALRDGAYQKASRMLDRAVQLDDEYALAHARLAEALTELEYDDKAKEEIIRASTLVPDPGQLPSLDKLYLRAITDTVMRDFGGAVENYRELVEKVPDAEKPYALVDLGRAYEKNEEVDKAIESYREATRREPKSATGFLRLGVLLGRIGRTGESPSEFEALEQAEKLYRDISDFEGVAEVFYQRGYIYQKMSRVAEATSELQQALAITSNTNNQYQRIKTLLQLGNVACVEGNTLKAQEYATQAIDAARANGNENLATRGLLDLGNAFFLRGETEEANKYFTRALEFAQRVKARRSEARSLLSLGSLHMQKGETDEGLRYVEQALPFYQQGNYRKEVSQALAMIGHANRRKGDFQAALKAFDEQLKMAAEARDQSQIARSHIDIGSLVADQERYPEALQHFDESYAIYKSLGNQFNAGFAALNRGQVLWRLGRYNEAEAAFTEASTIAERPQTGSKEMSASLYLEQAQMRLSQRRLGEARDRSQEALKLAEAEFKNVASDAKWTLGASQSLSGAQAQGRQTCVEAVGMAVQTSNPRLISNAQLALAEALLVSGDFGEARRIAQEAQETFARFNQLESEWRAWLAAARASRGLKDFDGMRAQLARADDLLSSLKQQWGADAFNAYLSRPDIQLQRQELNQTAAAAQTTAVSQTPHTRKEIST